MPAACQSTASDPVRQVLGQTVEPFAYSSIAEAHLGGDTFTLRTIRIESEAKNGASARQAQMGQAQIARFTSDGRLVSLISAPVGVFAVPRVPRARPAPEIPGAPPPPLLEGRGTVAVAAALPPGGRLEVQEAETLDPTSIAPLPAWAAFDRVLRAAVGNSGSPSETGNYVQLLVLDAGTVAGARVEARLELSNPLVAQLLARPFAILPAGNGPAAVRLLELLPLGRTRLVDIGGQVFALRQLRL